MIFVALVCSIFAGIKYKKIFFCLTAGFILLLCKQYLGIANVYSLYVEKIECLMYMIFFYKYITMGVNVENE